MNTRLPLFKIEAILHTYLRPFQCECRDASDSSLSVRLYHEPPDEELTVLGISYDLTRDAIWCVWLRNCASKCAPPAARCPPKRIGACARVTRLSAAYARPGPGGLPPAHVLEEHVVAVAVGVGRLLPAESLATVLHALQGRHRATLPVNA